MSNVSNLSCIHAGVKKYIMKNDCFHEIYNVLVAIYFIVVQTYMIFGKKKSLKLDFIRKVR